MPNVCIRSLLPSGAALHPILGLRLPRRKHRGIKPNAPVATRLATYANEKGGYPGWIYILWNTRQQENTTSEELKSINLFSDIITCRRGIVLLLDLDRARLFDSSLYHQCNKKIQAYGIHRDTQRISNNSHLIERVQPYIHHQ